MSLRHIRNGSNTSTDLSKLLQTLTYAAAHRPGTFAIFTTDTITSITTDSRDHYIITMITTDTHAELQPVQRHVLDYHRLPQTLT